MLPGIRFLVPSETVPGKRDFEFSGRTMLRSEKFDNSGKNRYICVYADLNGMNKELEPETIKELLRRIAAGDEAAFRSLYLAYYERLYQFARMQLHHDETAEDIVSELFFQLWKSRAGLPSIDNFNAYAYRAVRNGCNDSLRASSRKLDYDLSHPKMQVSVDPAFAADEEVDYQLLNNALSEAVEQLPERCRMIFKLAREDGMSHREIASVLEIAVTTVEGQLAIAKRRLKEVAAPFVKKI